MNLGRIKYLLWDLSGCRYIWNKVRPEKANDKPEPSSIVIWLVSLHLGLFTLASALYDSSKNSYDAKLSLVYTLLQIEEVKQLGINKITSLQGDQVLLKPSIYNPIDNIKSILRVKVADVENEKQLKSLLKYYKMHLSNSYLYQGDFSDIDNLSQAQFQNSYLQKSNFKDSSLIYADFSNSDLRNTNFQNSDLSFASFYQADLRGADLSGASGLDYDSLASAYSLFGSILDEDIEAELRLKGRPDLFLDK